MTTKKINKGEIILDEYIKTVRPCPNDPYHLLVSKLIGRKANRDIDSDSHFLMAYFDMPNISFIITTYNYSKYIEECLDSILNRDP